MKKDAFKIVLLLLILVTIPLIIVDDYKPFQSKILKENAQEDENWEYVKNKLFDGKTSYVGKRKGPVLLILENATKKDSVLVENAMSEIRAILPNKKVSYFKDFVEMSNNDFDSLKLKYSDTIKNYRYGLLRSSRIFLNFSTGGITLIGDEKGRVTIIPDKISGYNEFYHVSNKFSILRDNPRNKSFYSSKKIKFYGNGELAFDFKQRFIKYELMQCLFLVRNEKYYSVSRMSGMDINNYFKLSQSILEKDEFLLQKLYSEDFLDQFKEYLYSNYHWRYAYSFLNNIGMNFLVLVLMSMIGVVVLILMLSIFLNREFKYSFLNYFLPVLLIAYTFVQFYSLTIYLLYYEVSFEWDGLFESIIYMILGSIVISLLMWILERICVKPNMKVNFQLITKTAITFIVLNIPLLIIINNSFEGLFSRFFFDEIQFFCIVLFLFVLVLSLGRGLLIYLHHFSNSLIKQKDVELSRLKQLHAKAELSSLQAQINPHFLYNSLNSIASLAPIDSKKTQEMAHSLSDLFKYSINRKGKKMSTVKDEIEMVKSYLDIEKIRFGDRLQFVVEVDKDIENREIPLFLIQPLVENAVKHGISKHAGNGEIVLKIKEQQNELIITVSDSGPHFPEGLVSGHGLQTVYDLLRLSYDNKASLNWTNSPEKTITISIPKNI